jgi:hypothetical protein
VHNGLVERGDLARERPDRERAVVELADAGDLDGRAGEEDLVGVQQLRERSSAGDYDVHRRRDYEDTARDCLVEPSYSSASACDGFRYDEAHKRRTQQATRGSKGSGDGQRLRERSVAVGSDAYCLHDCDTASCDRLVEQLRERSTAGDWEVHCRRSYNDTARDRLVEQSDT